MVANLEAMLTRMTAVCALVCGPASLVIGQPVLHVTTPKDGTVVHPGQSLNVVVESSGGPVKGVFLVGTGPLGFSSKALEAPPYEFAMHIPSAIQPGTYNITAEGYTGSPVKDKSDVITIDAERADSPVGLRAEPLFLAIPAGERRYMSPIGEKAFITVHGSFGDGTTLDLSESTLTKFASDNPTVATLETHGQVKTVGLGSTKLIITNGKARLEIQLTVIKNDDFQERMEKLLPSLKEKQP